MKFYMMSDIKIENSCTAQAANDAGTKMIISESEGRLRLFAGTRLVNRGI
jgi:hypothetical protein